MTPEDERIFEEVMGAVYAIRNLDSGKAYIGSSIVHHARWRWHRWALRYGRHPNSYLQRAWNLYGEPTFEFLVLEDEISVDLLAERERHWLDTARSSSQVYNLQAVASWSGNKRQMTSEQKDKVSKRVRGRTLSDETRRRISQAHMGYKHTPEARRKMSESHKGRKRGPPSDEHRRKISEALRGRPKSEEHRRKISETLKGRKIGPPSDEHRRRISEARGRPYPAFYHADTEEIIPPGCNLSALCRERDLTRSAMGAVMRGTRSCHKGWVLL